LPKHKKTFQNFAKKKSFTRLYNTFTQLCKTLQKLYTTLTNCTTLDKKALYTALHNYTNLKTTLKTNKLRMSQKYITPKYFTRLFNFFLKQKLHNT
jgi:hypothetical protein